MLPSCLPEAVGGVHPYVASDHPAWHVTNDGMKYWIWYVILHIFRWHENRPWLLQPATFAAHLLYIGPASFCHNYHILWRIRYATIICLQWKSASKADRCLLMAKLRQMHHTWPCRGWWRCRSYTVILWLPLWFIWCSFSPLCCFGRFSVPSRWHICIYHFSKLDGISFGMKTAEILPQDAHMFSQGADN